MKITIFIDNQINIALSTKACLLIVYTTLHVSTKCTHFDYKKKTYSDTRNLLNFHVTYDALTQNTRWNPLTLDFLKIIKSCLQLTINAALYWYNIVDIGFLNLLIVDNDNAGYLYQP